MNDKIKQLAEQAMGTRKHVPPVWQFYDIELEEFAELIVEEFVNLAKNKSEFIVSKAELYAADADELDTAKATAWQFLVFGQEVKKHFGVE